MTCSTLDTCIRPMEDYGNQQMHASAFVSDVDCQRKWCTQCYNLCISLD